MRRTDLARSVGVALLLVVGGVLLGRAVLRGRARDASAATRCQVDAECRSDEVCTRGACAHLAIEEPEDEYDERGRSRKKSRVQSHMKDPTGEGAFDDARELGDSAASERDYVAMVDSLLRAELSGTRPGLLRRTFLEASPAEQDRLRFAAVDALANPELRSWIDADPARVQGARGVVSVLTPAEVDANENGETARRVDAFTAWTSFPYQIIIVPGYTPRDQPTPVRSTHPVARMRLESAAKSYADKQAPFVFLTGGNVHPRGTPFYEALEMKPVLVSLGVPAEAIIVEARARHSTTNLRNAGRFMLAHGLHRALIVAPGGGVGPWDQAFYFAHAERSTFRARCERELGYHVGELREAGEHCAEFKPAPDVTRLDYRDPLDP